MRNFKPTIATKHLICVTGKPAFSLLIVVLLLGSACLNSALADSTATQSSVWPTEADSMRYSPTHNALWGNAVDSNIQWVYDSGDANPFTDVIVANGLAYFGTMMNNIYAVDATTGKFAWKFTANNWIMTDPVVADGKLFAGSGNRYFQNADLRGTGKNSLYALDAKTGKELWEYPVPGEAMPTPVYNNGTVYFVTGDKALYALDANTGKLRYKINTDSYFSMSSPAIDGNMLYVGGGHPYEVYAFDTSTHSIAWQHSLPDVKWATDDSSIAISNGTILTEGVYQDYSVQNQLPTESIFALDEKTGAQKWSFNMGEGPWIDDNKAGTPVIVGNTVYVGSPISRRFYALDLATGKELWEFNPGVPIRGAATIINNYVVFNDINANLYVLNAKTGNFIDEIKLGGSVRPGGPAIYNGTIYISDQNGKIYAFPLFPLISGLYTKKQAAPITTSAASSDGSHYFSQTGHTVSALFYNYWQAHGGLAQFGYPISEPFEQFQADTGKTILVQYFERARFEYHPENAGTSNEVELGLLGKQVAASESSQKAFHFVATPSSTSATAQYFKATGHTLSGTFLSYWNANGGLARYGYPISEPFQEVNNSDGKTYTVQYFERARFEYHPENAGTAYGVELGQLGKLILSKDTNAGLQAALHLK